MAFDPAALGSARATQAAQRRVADWANSTLSALAESLPDPEARLSIRQVSCTDPECATPEGVEVLVTLTAKEWSCTAKLLKAATRVERGEVEQVVADLCRGAQPRALAARARRLVEEGAHAGSAGPVSMGAESFAVRVLTRIGDEFAGREEDRVAALRVLRQALDLELGGELGGPLGARAHEATSRIEPAGESTPSSVRPSETLPTGQREPPATHFSARRPGPAPDLAGELGGSRRLLESDGDEADLMGKHEGRRGLSCPCCNPDDPRFLADKMLMM